MADKFTGSQIFNFIGGSVRGESSFELWKSLNPNGTAQEFLEYLKDDMVDAELSETSANSVQNKAVTKKLNALGEASNTMQQVTTKLKQEIAVERARINTFTELEEGSTTGDAELIDARIDYTGEVWDNVGDHIRGVSSQLSSQIDDISEVSYNLLPIGESEGYTLNGVSASYSDGIISLVGVSTERITRINKIVEFSLPKGTQTISALDFPVNDKLKGIYLVNKQTNENISVVGNEPMTYTLENDTECYLSIDCYEQCVLNNEVSVQITKGENAQLFQKPSYVTANDKMAREKIVELDEYVGKLKESKIDLNDISEGSYNLLPIDDSNGYSLNGVSASYSDGIISLVGVSTETIARTNKIVEFSLPKGTNTLLVKGLPVTDKLKGVYLVKKQNDENIVVVYNSQKTFTLDDDTDCYLSINCYAQCVFDNTEVCVQITKGENTQPFQKPSYVTVIDKTARYEIEELEARLKGNEDLPLAKIDKLPTFITMFKRIVHIGDSLTEGAFNTTYPNTNGIAIKEYSRVAMMGKYLGNENVNLGFGGATVSSENSWNWLRAIDESDRKTEWENYGDCYIIALGTNDITKLGSFTGNASTDIDLNNYDNNAQTSVGCYAKIIQIIKANQPKAKIFCVTIPQSRNTKADRDIANPKIKAIANLLDCYVIDLETYAEQDNSFATTYKNGSHNNVLGYNLRARQYIAYIDWIIENNLDDFRNVQFVGTEYDYQ